MGEIHAKVLSAIDGVSLSVLVANDIPRGQHLATQMGIARVTADYQAVLSDPQIDAVVIATPSDMHVDHAVMAAEAGKACLLEIPASLNLAGAYQIAAAQERSGTPIMVAHSRRFSPAHQFIKRGIETGSFNLQHLVAQTFFMRRSNVNMLGQSRGWTDSLLWHHACHTVDLFSWLLDEDAYDVWAQRGPIHPELGIAMDMSIGMRSRTTGQLLTLALSFNNRGPFGGFYRYIGQEETYLAYRDELTDADGQIISSSGSAFDIQDREFIDAIRSRRPPQCGIHSVMRSMILLDQIEQVMRAGEC